jgi:hypothetical protein
MAEFSRARRVAIAATAVFLLLLAAVVLPPLINAGRFRERIAANIGAAIGRPVRMDAVTMRLLPRPGFELTNFVVGEDPAFGYEPAMRAHSVTAAVRWLPLLAGRIEIARISLTEPSVNLERNAQGHWNFESILERTQHISAAPTSARAKGTQPRFPYVEATGGRINFKRGAEKLPLSLTDSELALWLDSPDEWRFRLRAQPVRTDLNAAESGALEVQASIHRDTAGAPGLASLHAEMSAEWRRIPVGQFTRLMRGRDEGWRGLGDVRVTLRGTSAEAAFTARVGVEDFRRTEFVPSQTMDIDALCAGSVTAVASPRRTIKSLQCNLPAGGGNVAVTLATEPSTRVHIAAANVSDAWLMEMAGRAAPSLAASGATVDGLCGGAFDWDETAARRLSGAGECAPFALHVPGLVNPMTAARVRFVAGGSAVATQSARPERGGRRARGAAVVVAAPSAPLEMQPVSFALGAATPLVVSAGFSRAGWALSVSGAAGLRELLAVGQAAGLAAAQKSLIVGGTASGMHIVAGGPWLSTASTQGQRLEGSFALKDVVAQTQWLRGPVRIATATVTFAPAAGEVRWSDVSGTWAGLRLDGSASRAMPCPEAPAKCSWTINLHTAELSAATLRRNFAAGQSNAGLLSVFGGSKAVALPRADVNLTIGTFGLGPLALHGMTAQTVIRGQQIAIDHLSANALGGEMTASGVLDFAAAKYTIDAKVAGATLTDAAAMFHEQWGKGTADAQTSLVLSRLDARAADTAAGTFSVTVRDGGLSAAEFAATPFAKFSSWRLDGDIGSGQLKFAGARLQSGSATQDVDGTIGINRSVRWAVKGKPPLTVSGNLQPAAAGVRQ